MDPDRPVKAFPVYKVLPIGSMDSGTDGQVGVALSQLRQHAFYIFGNLIES